MTVSYAGAASKSYGGATLPANSVRVAAYFTPTGSTTRTLVASTTTTVTGSYSLRVFPKASGTWTVVLLAMAGYSESSAPPRAVTVG